MQLSNFKTNFNLKDFIEAGILIDTETYKPSYNDYIYGIRFKHTVYDLRKSSLNLRKAMEYINTLCSKPISSGSIGFITVSENTPLLKTTSLLAKKSFQQGYTSYKWLGGFLSNWKTVVKKHIALERRYKKNRSLLAQMEKNICISKKRSKKEVTSLKFISSKPIVTFLSNLNKELSKNPFIDSDYLKSVFKNQFKLFKKDLKKMSQKYKQFKIEDHFLSTLHSKKIVSLRNGLETSCSNLTYYNVKHIYKNDRCKKLISLYLNKYLNQIKFDLPNLLKGGVNNSKRLNKNIFTK